MYNYEEAGLYFSYTKKEVDKKDFKKEGSTTLDKNKKEADEIVKLKRRKKSGRPPLAQF